MTDTSHPKLVYMDDILGSDGLAAIDHEDGYSSFPSPKTSVADYLL